MRAFSVFVALAKASTKQFGLELPSGSGRSVTIELVSVAATMPATWARAFSQASVASQM